MDISVDQFVHELLAITNTKEIILHFSSSSETFGFKITGNLEDMFPIYYTHSDVLNLLKSTSRIISFCSISAKLTLRELSTVSISKVLIMQCNWWYTIIIVLCHMYNVLEWSVCRCNIHFIQSLGYDACHIKHVRLN